MNSGVIVLVLIILLRYLGWGGSGNKNLSGPGEGAISYRAVFVAVLGVVLYFACSFALSTYLDPFVKRIGIHWLEIVLGLVFYFWLPLLLIRRVPPWIAWRLARHLQHPLPARAIFWLTPGVKASCLSGFAQFLAASHGHHPLPDRSAPPSGWRRWVPIFPAWRWLPPADIGPWTPVALALWAERQGDLAAATRYLSALADVFQPQQIPRLVRLYAFETLARRMAKRGDWQTVAQCARLGVGRSYWFFRCLALGHVQDKVVVPWLLTTWLLAPERVSNFPLLKGALFPKKTPEEVPSDDPVATVHLRLLQAASIGRPIELLSVLRLAHVWQQRLTRETQAQLLSRGMELGARDIHQTVDLLPGQILAELEELAFVAKGMIPEEITANWEEWRETLPGDVILRLRDRLFVRLEAATARFFPDDGSQPPPLVECLEHWLTVSEAAQRLADLMGEDDLVTAWHGGLCGAAWNGACWVLDAYQDKSRWLCYLMFNRVVALAERCDDERAAEVNRRNVAACGIAPVDSSAWSLRAWRGFRGALSLVGSWSLARFSIVLPCGGTLALALLARQIWSMETLVTSYEFSLPVLIGSFSLLYVLSRHLRKWLSLDRVRMPDGDLPQEETT